jgi:hypothetical protein
MERKIQYWAIAAVASGLRKMQMTFGYSARVPEGRKAKLGKVKSEINNERQHQKKRALELQSPCPAAFALHFRGRIF